VFETVAKELGDWLRAHKDVHIGVNCPPELLGRGGLEYVAAKTGLFEIKDQLIIEVTERGIPDALGLATLEAASKAGIRVALDDVTLTGTNLALVSRYALDLIKTDKSLVDQIAPDSPRPAWLAGLSALLQATPLEVICEGVETEAQAQVLREAGIPMAQGYYFSRPISAEGLKAYYARSAPPPDGPA
jgi:EAL domain-containing protein (putative c-di-GMP-specific phosphodiesterase class I)